MPPRRKPNAKGETSARCAVCQHTERWRVELLRAGGASLDSLSEKFGLHRDAIWRHQANHVPKELLASYLAGPVQLQELAAKAADSGASVIDNLNAVRVVLMGHLSTLTEAGDARGSAYVASKLVDTLTTIAKVTGELSSLAANTININNTQNIVLAEHPAFLRMQAAMLRALAAYPDARAAVVAALRGLEETPAVKVIEHA